MQFERNGFHVRNNGQHGRPHNVWDDRLKGILGARPADPVNTPWRSWDAATSSDADTFAQGSQATREVSGLW
jgi:hypothetical protein